MKDAAGSVAEQRAKLAEKVVAANVQMHNALASSYDIHHVYVTNRRHTQKILSDIAAIAAIVDTGGAARPTVLDCGCGTGYLSLIMSRSGLRVTGVDVSEKMLEELRRKVGEDQIETVCSELEAYLRQRDRQYDVVTFHSVLHHLPDYERVLELAADRVAANGAMYIAMEPLSVKCPQRLRRKLAGSCNSILGILRKIILQPSHISHIAHRLWGRLAGNEAYDEGLAEYHVSTGIDRQRVLQILAARGLYPSREEFTFPYEWRIVNMMASCVRLEKNHWRAVFGKRQSILR